MASYTKVIKQPKVVCTHTSACRPSSSKYFWNDGEPKMIKVADRDIQLDGIVETPHHIYTCTNNELKLNVVAMQQHRAHGRTGQWVIKYTRTTSGERFRITDDRQAIKSRIQSGRLPAIRSNKRREYCAINFFSHNHKEP